VVGRLGSSEFVLVLRLERRFVEFDYILKIFVGDSGLGNTAAIETRCVDLVGSFGYDDGEDRLLRI
jgi:hypothetical protein